MVSARAGSPVSLSVLTSVSHDTGSPFPSSHSLNTLRVILSGLSVATLYLHAGQSTACGVIEEEDAKLEVVGTDCLRNTETQQLRQSGWRN